MPAEQTHIINGGAANPAIISVEYPNKKVDKDDAFEIKIGIGQNYDYPEAEFRIATGKLTIMLSDGTEVGKQRILDDGKVVEEYYAEFSNFDSEKYDCAYDKKTHIDYPTYIETFKFIYNGTQDEYADGFTIWLRIIPAEGQGLNNLNHGKPVSNAINLYYRVKNGKIEFGRLPFN
jgi:hypothetical protein